MALSRTSLLPLIGLVAIVTGAAYGLSRSTPVVVLSILSVLLIVGSVRIMMGSHDGGGEAEAQPR